MALGSDSSDETAGAIVLVRLALKEVLVSIGAAENIHQIRSRGRRVVGALLSGGLVT